MYVYVVVQELEPYYQEPAGGGIKARLEQASGEPCLLVPYQNFTAEMVKELQPRAVCMSGFGTKLADKKVEWFHGMNDALRAADIPMLCFCGSHQLLGMFYTQSLRRLKAMRGRNIRLMRKLKRGEDLPRRVPRDPESDMADYFCAEGFFPITRVKPDPLFRGLPKTMMMRCSHYCEVVKLPQGFELLATSGHCRIAAMRHAELPVYGTQFHPEAYEAPFLHGRKLLENFARITEGFWKKREAAHAE